jgi:hypothetical protein
MNRAFFASYNIPESSNKLISIPMLEKLKAFIEIELCNESKSIMALHPSALRLLCKLNITSAELQEQDRPINYYDDTLLGANY